MTGLALGLVLPIAATFTVLRRFLGQGNGSVAFAAGLAVGLGLGLSGLLLVAWRLTLPASWMPVYPFVDTAFWISVGAMAMLKPRPIRPPGHSVGVAVETRWGLLDWGLIILLLLTGLASLRYFALHSVRLPHGEWDAWAVWNLKARFLFLGGSNWTDLFSSHLPHAGYPLMLPGAVARLWIFGGTPTPIANGLVAALFTYATPLVVAGSLAYLRNWRSALWGALLTMSAVPLTFVGAFHIADVPLAWGIMAAVALIAADSSSPRGVTGAVVGGFALTVAALSKDEGLPFMIGMTLLFIGVAVNSGHPRRGVRVGAFVMASVPAWLMLATVRRYATSAGIAQALLADSAIDKVVDAERHLQISKAFVETMWSWSGTLGFGAAPFFLAALLLGGYRLHRRLRIPFVLGLATILTMLAAYYVAFVVTPYDLTWHLTSLDRVLVHIWPVAAWTFCLGSVVGAARRSRSTVPADSLRT